MKTTTNKITLVFTSFVFLSFASLSQATERVNPQELLEVGKPLPNAMLKQYEGPDIQLKDIKGKIKIISIVPQLNTPVCDEQTHRLSETNGGLDKLLDIITISTNSAKGQYEFAKKANIKNLIFLSDAPRFDFGKNTGLLNEKFGYLKRTVLIVDEDNIIRYIDFVPGGGLPNIKKALNSARKILQKKGAELHSGDKKASLENKGGGHVL